MISQQEFRSHFDSLGDRLYFNHAAYSPMSRPVAETIKYYLDVRMEGSSDTWTLAVDHLETLRSNYAALINTTADRIALTGNTGSGLIALANGMNWQTGDHILLYAHEFPANVTPFYNLKRLGVDVELVQDVDGRLTPEQFASKLRPQTRLISLSSVQYLTGYRANLKPFSDLCHENGIIFCVDAIQSLGVIPMDVVDMGIDFLSAGAYKWMMAPIGTGFLYLTEALQEKLQVTGLGYMGNENPERYDEFDQELHPDARRFEVGAFPAPGVAGARKALDLLLACGIDNIQKHVSGLTEQFLSGLKNTAFEPVYTFSKEERAGICLFKHKNQEQNEEVFKRLTAQKVNIALRGGGLRFAPHYYNTSEEVDRFLAMLAELS
ncbi:MAG: aminotransferase class V-fold PLP-dependent enzyme [Candidatus Marinimicrobia bacterium]|nr:aminotransferase class V-fold PLP-dependent enzyme [Candidatus Neomarinimicrobiota bacterium]MCF7904536.1 aminotransferase class V-fold PLP-dependent enzyme [Candidatus Neomarinimicrobiota bacterium]